MIVEKIQMPSRQPRNFCQRVIDKLGIKSASALEERVFVTEGAVVRAAARNDDRVRNQVGMSLNQIAANRRDSFQSSHRGFVTSTRRSRCKVTQKLRKRVFARTEKNGVSVRRGFIRQ